MQSAHDLFIVVIVRFCSYSSNSQSSHTQATFCQRTWRLAKSDSDSLFIFYLVFVCFRLGQQLHSVHLLARWKISFSTRQDNRTCLDSWSRSRCRSRVGASSRSRSRNRVEPTPHGQRLHFGLQWKFANWKYKHIYI